MKKIFLVLLMLLNLQAKSFFSNDDQKEASKYLMAVKDLIVAAQKTRGATYSYANGNENAMMLVYMFRDDMNSAIRTMESLPLSKNPIIGARTTTISSAFVKLNSKALKMKPNEAFDAYTENIAQTLLLAQSVSQIGSEKMSPFGKKVTSIMMETILPLSEWMGQLRAIGSAACAKGGATKKDKIKMQILMSKIAKLDQELQIKMSSAIKDNPSNFSPDVKERLANAHKAISHYLSITKKEVMKDKTNYNPDDYFALATDTIDSVIALFDIGHAAINEDAKGWF
ncbi:Methyl-accepting chemotaxis protein [hydrothermal vent metagenome]|uniref:Methyl-accepting chemotaxis protein n=1 Tax=hydrothermal vent metagenome TaxID=652676 RepID=A0A1W1C3G0_9ZZZZ